jgi:CBS domain containing-hemolysin-like protein
VNELALISISVLSFMLGAFFSGCETAFIASDPIRLKHLAARGNSGARLVLGYLEDSKYFLSSVLVGTNLAVVGCTTTATAVATRHFGDAGATVATAVLVPLFLVFNEMLPKGIFLYYATTAAVLCAFPLKVFSFILSPVIKSFAALSDFFLRFTGMELKGKQLGLTMEELLFHLEDSEEAGLISEETVDMVEGAVKLGELKASEVMIPLARVAMVRKGLGREEYEEAFRRTGFTRLPVYEKERHNVIGVLSIHGLLEAAASRGEGMELEEPYVVPRDAPVEAILVKMKDQGRHMAFVTDERGRIAGMLTLEDILETIVGAIADEFH